MLPDIVESADRDRVAQPRALALREFRANGARLPLHPGQFRAEGGSNRNTVEFVQDALAFSGLAAPPGRDIRHEQVLTKQTMRESGQEREHGARLEHSGARHVFDRDAALPDSLQQARHANARGRIEFERIAPVRVDMPPDDVASFEAGDCADEDPPLAHDEVIALDEQEAEVTRQIRLFVVGQTQRAGAQDADAGLGPLAGRLQTRPQRAEEGRKPLNVKLGIEIRKRLGDDEAIL